MKTTLYFAAVALFLAGYLIGEKTTTVKAQETVPTEGVWELAKTGRVVLSGDLYHFPEERKLGRIPTFDFNEEQTRQSREKIEAFLKQAGAQLWIQHDFVGNAKLKKAPNFYD
jgi:hypothetical protein